MTDGVQEPVNDASKSAEPSELSVETATDTAIDTAIDTGSEATPEPASEAAAVESVASEPAAAKVEDSVATAKALEGAAQRRSPWQSSMAAIQYVGQASATDEVQVRTSDSVIVMGWLTRGSSEGPSLVYSPLASMRVAFMSISDVVLAVAVTMFLVYRLGILSSLGKRQALICWQLMMGCIFLGIFLCVNVAAGVALGVSAMYPAELPADIR